jgi:hemerythrin
LFQWDDSYSVGIKEIDDQHEQLFQIVSELNDSMRLGKGKDVIGKTLEGLIGYTQTHFALEEKYFARFGYPETAAHKIEHQQLTGKVLEFQKEFLGGKVALSSVSVLQFLSDWLRTHIEKSDKAYAAFFKANGLL